ncbi:MAG: 6-phosphofructokinase [Clostridiales Family XIII bacterium]|jgi:6-phosphofructokinase 1|nr:6-phosphofructokinase [Clostridiales Family XIII bacterium]
MKRIGVLTSGGDAPGMNACIRACVRTAHFLDMEIFGIERGYDGLIAGDIRQLGPRDVSDTIQRGGTMLKTARSSDFQTEEGFARALAMMGNFKLEGLIVIGGNGSLTGATDLKKAGIRVVGLPGTIDNDLPFTDYTIGFDTAVNTALWAISNVRDTSNAHERVTIVDVMGRECGDIAIYAAITGGAEIVLVPEIPIDLDDVCRSLIESRNRGKTSSIIVKAEGVDIDSNVLDEEITKRTGLDVKVVVLGYIQRGGSPTAADRLLASTLGSKAVELLHDDISGVAVGSVGGSIIWSELEEAMSMKKASVCELDNLAKMLAI